MRKSYLLLFLMFFISVCASAQSLTDNPTYVSLIQEQQTLKASEDSLSSKLAQSRKLFEEGTKDEKKIATDDIVRLEGVIYDLRANLSRVSSRIAAIEQEFAANSLKTDNGNKIEKRGFYNNPIFTDNVARKNLAMLSSSGRIEQQILNMGAPIKELYAKLHSIKVAYDMTTSQSELDRLKAEGIAIQEQIIKANADARSIWSKFYNFKADTYLSIMDKLGEVDRTTTENLANAGREVRRAEALTDGMMLSQFAVLDAQRKYLQSYEKIIAQSQGLRMALDSLARLKPIAVGFDSLKKINFDPRILTLYAPVTFRKNDMPISTVDQIDEVILPEKGVYYSVQIALMAAEPKSLEMFKGAWPLQVEHTSDGKLRYMVGGFRTYAEAQAAVVQLQKAGYKAPILTAWIDGRLTTAAKAKAYEASQPKSEGTAGSYKIEISTTDSSVGEKLKSLVDIHAKGKNVARTNNGSKTVFTIVEFDDKYEAQVLAQIIVDRTGAKAEVKIIE